MNETSRRAAREDDGTQARELMFAIVNTGRAIEQRLEEALAPVGLSLAKFGALTHLVEAGESLSLTECARRMTCVRSNITQLMDRLEADGLVQRVADRQDRRVVRASITPRGVERQAAGAALVAQVQAALLESLDSTDRDGLSHALSAIR